MSDNPFKGDMPHGMAQNFIVNAGEALVSTVRKLLEGSPVPDGLLPDILMAAAFKACGMEAALGAAVRVSMREMMRGSGAGEPERVVTLQLCALDEESREAFGLAPIRNTKNEETGVSNTSGSLQAMFAMTPLCPKGEAVMKDEAEWPGGKLGEIQLAMARHYAEGARLAQKMQRIVAEEKAKETGASMLGELLAKKKG